MGYQNYKGDFIRSETFFRMEEDGSKTQIPVPEHVRVEYFTKGNCSRFVAERNGDEYKNCTLSEDGMSLAVNVALSRTPIGQGEMFAIVTEFVTDCNFPGGVRQNPVPYKTDVILYCGPSDNSLESSGVSILASLTYGYSAYELAVQHGYEGTEDEWLDSLQYFQPVTWSELKALRDGGKLIPGKQYRITDYVTTVRSSYTDARSAGHQFDVIVTAVDTNKLSEEACAALHEGDTYFAKCRLNAWKLNYCLDNDTKRFYWADSTAGKGVIYRMIDEWENDCSCDFKNIQYKVNEEWFYTFGRTDYSLDGKCHHNVVKYDNNREGDYLCYTVFDSSYCSYNHINGEHNILGVNCNYNHIEGNYHTLGKYCNNNLIEGNRHTLGNYCSRNTILGAAYGEGLSENNVIGNKVTFCTIGQNCKNITIQGTANGRVSYVVVKSHVTNYVVKAPAGVDYETIVALNSKGEVVTYCTADLVSEKPEQKYFTKVYAAPTNWAGKYLIICESEKAMFNGALDELDVVENNIPILPGSGKILVTEELLAYAFDINEAGTLIRSASGHYIGNSSDSNGLKHDKEYQNEISFVDDELRIVSAKSVLRFNAASNQRRFRYYASSSFTSQKAIQLYKLEE